jgi:hypothetical protein
MLLEAPADLLGTVERMPPAQRDHGVHDGTRRRMRTSVGPAGAIGQAGRALLPVPRELLLASLPAHMSDLSSHGMAPPGGGA